MRTSARSGKPLSGKPNRDAAKRRVENILIWHANCTSSGRQVPTIRVKSRKIPQKSLKTAWRVAVEAAIPSTPGAVFLSG